MRKAAINRGTLNALILMLALTENGRTNASTRKHNVQAVLSPESHSRLGVIGQTGRTHPHQAWMLDQIIKHTACIGNAISQLNSVGFFCFPNPPVNDSSPFCNGQHVLVWLFSFHDADKGDGDGESSTHHQSPH